MDKCIYIYLFSSSKDRIWCSLFSLKVHILQRINLPISYYLIPSEALIL